MNEDIIIQQFQQQKKFFDSNKTKSIDSRIKALERFRNTILKYESQVIAALHQDLGKSAFESYTTEINIVLGEIALHIKKLKKWAKPQKKDSPLIIFPSKSYIYKEPYGVVLIIGTWNYPFHLLFNPLVCALSAGNCAILKTAPYAPNTSEVLEKIVCESFAADYVTLFHGNREVTQKLLTLPFDLIFYTGNPTVGKVVMEAAAQHLTPVILELGGKSPCIVDKDADIKLAAKRIAWGKTINCGQTCIAPDYLFIHNDVKYEFAKEFKKAITDMFGEDVKKSPDYPRLISVKATHRLAGFLKSGIILMGGDHDIYGRFIEPTLLCNVHENSYIMQEEIFGPILPMIEFSEIKTVIQYIKAHEKPLALYYFTKDKKKAEKVLHETSSGGVCINDTLLHITNPHLPFGGVGNSGMGAYHGKFGFDAMSHQKAVVKSTFLFDLKIKYPPYKGKLSLFKKLLNKK